MKSNGISKVTVHTLAKMKAEHRKISMLTAYDASFSRLIDQAGCDIILVGDSLGMVVQGGGNTLPVTMEEMIYHCRSVKRGTERAQVVGDMPFMSYQASLEEGIRNAGRLVKEGGAEAVKLEGGADYAELAHRLSKIGIPVMGHIGLTPQSLHSMGGFKVQGRSAAQAKQLLEDARALEQAGCYSIVLEGIPQELAQQITASLTIPTIGIGAGVHCDGQVLVIYDLLGMNEEFRPKFVKRYDNLAVRIRTAVEQYITEVRNEQFPDAEHSFSKDAPRPENATPYSSARAAAGGGSAPERDPDATGAACIPLPFPRKK
jgi:3-methyl-2-oxobutanoate hydroxymethyltransferase